MNEVDTAIAVSLNLLPSTAVGGEHTEPTDIYNRAVADITPQGDYNKTF